MEGVKRQVMELKNLRWSGNFFLFHQILLAILHHAKLALIVNIVGRLSMKFKGNILRV